MFLHIIPNRRWHLDLLYCSVTCVADLRGTYECSLCINLISQVGVQIWNFFLFILQLSLVNNVLLVHLIVSAHYFPKFSLHGFLELNFFLLNVRSIFTRKKEKVLEGGPLLNFSLNQGIVLYTLVRQMILTFHFI